MDGTPVREFKNSESIGVPFPKNQPMRIYSSLGMLMIGQQGVDLSRQTGAKHPLLLPTETSKLMLAHGLLEHHLVDQLLLHLPPIVVYGFHKSWTVQVKRG